MYLASDIEHSAKGNKRFIYAFDTQEARDQWLEKVITSEKASFFNLHEYRTIGDWIKEPGQPMKLEAEIAKNLYTVTERRSLHQFQIDLGLIFKDSAAEIYQMLLQRKSLPETSNLEKGLTKCLESTHKKSGRYAANIRIGLSEPSNVKIFDIESTLIFPKKQVLEGRKGLPDSYIIYGKAPIEELPELMTNFLQTARKTIYKEEKKEENKEHLTKDFVEHFSEFLVRTSNQLENSIVQKTSSLSNRIRRTLTNENTIKELNLWDQAIERYQKKKSDLILNWIKPFSTNRSNAIGVLRQIERDKPEPFLLEMLLNYWKKPDKESKTEESPLSLFIHTYLIETECSALARDLHQLSNQALRNLSEMKIDAKTEKAQQALQTLEQVISLRNAADKAMDSNTCESPEQHELTLNKSRIEKAKNRIRI